MKYYQQGDVILKKVAELPSDAVKLKDAKILQLSERSGNAHMFLDQTAVDLYVSNRRADEKNDLADISFITTDEGKFVVVSQPTALTHTNYQNPTETWIDHETQQIEPGVYEVDIVMEQDLVSKQIRRAID